MKHFLKETDFNPNELPGLFALAQNLKTNRGKSNSNQLEGQTWGMIFFKSSTRTRVSFEVGIHELGGKALFLDKSSLQLSRGESVADTAKILSRYIHGLVIRAFDHEVVEGFAAEGTIPIINALTDFLHPCQIYSDAFTLAEHWSEGRDVGSLRGKKLVFFGDCGSNMAHSWILGAALFGMEIVLTGPEEFSPSSEIDNLLAEENLPLKYSFTTNPKKAVSEADVVYTDVWVSMGNESEKLLRLEKMKPYTVTKDILKRAKPKAVFMHCLPAHPGLEVMQEVLDSSQSIVFDQAENRLHMQKAIMSKLARSH